MLWLLPSAGIPLANNAVKENPSGMLPLMSQFTESSNSIPVLRYLTNPSIGINLSPIQPPLTEWVRQFGTWGDEKAFGVAVDNKGNIYLTGYTDGQLMTQPEYSGKDAFVRKYNAAGNELWTRQFGSIHDDSARSVAVDSTDNIYVAGTSGGAFPDYYGSEGIYNFIRKYAPGGDELWTRQFGYSIFDKFLTLSLDVVNNLYIGGEMLVYWYPGAMDLDAVIRKYSPLNNEKWSQQFGTPRNDSVNSITVDVSGNIYVSGFSQGDFIERDDNARLDTYIRKYDTELNVLWTKQFASYGSAYNIFSVVDKSGNLYIAGSTDVFLPGMSSAGKSDAYLRKYDPSGNVVWTRQFGTFMDEEVNSLAMDIKGNLYIAGKTSGVLPGQTSSGPTDAFIRKYDSAGNEIWTYQFGTSRSDAIQSIVLDFTGNIYAAGFTDGSFSGQTASGKTDAFLIKITQSSHSE